MDTLSDTHSSYRYWIFSFIFVDILMEIWREARSRYVQKKLIKIPGFLAPFDSDLHQHLNALDNSPSSHQMSLNFIQ